MARPVILAIDDPRTPRVIKRDLHANTPARTECWEPAAANRRLMSSTDSALTPLPRPTPLARRRRGRYAGS